MESGSKKDNQTEINFIAFKPLLIFVIRFFTIYFTFLVLEGLQTVLTTSPTNNKTTSKVAYFYTFDEVAMGRTVLNEKRD